MKQFNWKKHIDEALQATDYCALATVDKEKGVWVNPVYFACDNEYNLYFISLMQSRHMQNIAKDNHVSVAIYKTEQKGDVIGIQLQATATILTDEKERKHAHQIYYARTGSLEQNEFAMHDPQWIFVKITPIKKYYFNSKVFVEGFLYRKSFILL